MQGEDGGQAPNSNEELIGEAPTHAERPAGDRVTQPTAPRAGHETGPSDIPRRAWWRDALTPAVIGLGVAGGIGLLVLSLKTKASWPAIAAAGIGIFGLLLWLPSGRERTSRADFGTGLATGAVITGMFFFLTLRDEQAQSNVAHREELSLQLTLQRNLSGVDLSNDHLQKFDLGSKNLSDAQLYGVRLDHAELQGANLNGAKLNLAQLPFAKMRGATLVNASLSGANLANANVNEGVLRGATAGMYVLGPGNHAFADFQHAALIDVDLRGACLAGADLRGAQLGGANLQNADLDNAKLQGATFESAMVPPNLAGASFYGAQLGGHPNEGAPSAALTYEHPPLPDSPRPPEDAVHTRVTSVYDGDTIELDHLGWTRLIGVNTPGLSDRADAPPADRVGYLASTLTRSLVPPGSAVLYAPLRLKREDKPGKTGRWLIYLWTSAGVFLNETLIERGMGLYETDQRAGSRYANQLKRAQTFARGSGLGVWATCPDFPANDAVLLPVRRRR